MLGQTATTATKTARYMRRRDADPFCGTNQPLFLCGRLCMLNKKVDFFGVFFFSFQIIQLVTAKSQIKKTVTINVRSGVSTLP